MFSRTIGTVCIVILAGLSGCTTLPEDRLSEFPDPFNEIFRYRKQTNVASAEDIIKIDYSQYDKAYDYRIVENRAYLDPDTAPSVTKEVTVDLPPLVRYRVPAINATYIVYGEDSIILKYNCRVGPPELKTIIEPYLPGIQITEYNSQNALLFSGKRESFGDFSALATMLNEFDVPPQQIRVRVRIVEYFNDNTYERDLSLRVLRRGMQAFAINLPSGLDPTVALSRGLDFSPFLNSNDAFILDAQGNVVQRPIVLEDGSMLPPRHTFESAVKFLDSYGRTETLADVDMLVNNGQSVEFKNMASVPYAEFVVTGGATIETSRYRDTGTDFKITPHANEEGFIIIKLEKTISGEQTGFVGSLQRPTFRESNLISEFTVRNGVTYFAGTSLLTRYKSVTRGIPLLNKIPLIKLATTARLIEKNQTQLLYFIEARIIPRDSLVGVQLRE